MPPKTAKATRPRVYARIRPMFGRDAGQPELFDITDTTLSYEKEEGAQPTMFQLDKVFNMESRQEDVFETIGEVALSSLRQGFNSTVFCYGPSGTGKSYTCYGPEGAVGGVIDAASTPRKHTSAARWAGSPEAGLIPRAAAQLFGEIERARHGRFLLRVSFVQLYRENLSDLLAPASGALHIREDPSRGVFVEGLTEVAVRSPHDAWALAARGQRQRTTARRNTTSPSPTPCARPRVTHAARPLYTAGSCRKPRP